jgi:hypothetical protein
MNRILFALLIVTLGFFSCNKEVPPLTKEQVKQKIDSLVKIRRLESDEQAKVDLDHRLKIEVKVKVDSILNARLLQQAKDTLKKKSTQLMK